MINEDEIEILYNNKYGGWGISQKAIALYNFRTSNLYDFGKDNYCRHDPILIQIYKELGPDFDYKFSRSIIKKIPKKFENYYYIEEYDGKETVRINNTKYKLDNLYNNIKTILQSTNNNNLKINDLEELISAFEM